MRKHFALSHLPLELALEILRLAASPSAHCTQKSSDAVVYTTACILARVSHNVRHAIMPHLLHTVVFRTQQSLDLFLDTLEQQNHFAATNSTLKIDYRRYVRRIWSSECFEPVLNQHKDSYRNYSLLSPIFINAYDIGLTKNSMHLLHEVLDGRFISSVHPSGWNCKRVTIAGNEHLRWNGMVATEAGHSFLRQLTHFTLWSNPTHAQAPGIGVSANNIPAGVHKVPLDYMPNLTHFAFTLNAFDSCSNTVPVYVYILPPALRGSGEGGKLVRKWLSGDIQLDSNAFVRHLRLRDSNNVTFAPAFYKGTTTHGSREDREALS
ncbi:hypothetical protein BJ912DRAFT_1054459 [Pholiota molesta]|nr:hypothetical protein BJ912DRAFT_1054459 [Pholiota molesta]